MTSVRALAPGKDIVISSDNEVGDFGGQMPLRQVRLLTGSMLLTFEAILIFLAADGLTMPMRVALMVFATTLVCWTIFDLPETPVALAGALVLGATGTVSEEAVFAALGNDIVWRT
ncbi:MULTISPECIES: hypothetical protein [unclassified Ensifer]|uniref:hypothetical protein n=1 Tax=unclassified Ensifer TaxID=2633371 RepID=UPI0008137FF2|nr:MULTISPECIES: hypothetical protein [unclassified Ensifer]OCP19175.1 hypothetical protein BC361_05705 [Ensifer sp. LC54]OCP27332.1 hypothetical protein BC363_14555 [Ensifer sp. LC384]